MQGKLVIVGGALEDSALKVHKYLIDQVRPELKLGIVPTASGQDPESTINNVKNIWTKLGVEPERILVIPVYGQEGKAWKDPAPGDDESIVSMLEGIGGLWFTGGDQYYTHKAFVRKDGSDTKALRKLREILNEGGVIGGTSAGAAIMSDLMIAGGDNLAALKYPLEFGYEDYDDADHSDDRLRLVKGLGFFTEGVIDQHFDQRPRILRLIRASLHRGKELMGYGVSEDTAMVYDFSTRLIQVIGSSGLYIVDCNNVKKTKKETCNLSDVKLHVLQEGDTYNLLNNKIDLL